MIEPRLLGGRARYERVMDGWTDDVPGDALRHTVRLADDDRAIEVELVATPSPEYAIREAGCRVLRGGVAPGVAAGAARLAGARMVAGFTRRVAAAVGAGAGAGLVVDAAVEVARLARQVAKVPRGDAERAVAGGPLACWELDRVAWAELPDSCFTYTAAGRALFGARAVTTPTVADLYSPRPGRPRVFVRRKIAWLERDGGRLRLFHSMHDHVHGFEVTYAVDRETGRIIAASHTTPRLPYLGVCSEPQTKIATLVGETVDEGLVRRLGTKLGGPTGCAQLYDLTADLLKLLAA